MREVDPTFRRGVLADFYLEILARPHRAGARGAGRSESKPPIPTSTSITELPVSAPLSDRSAR